MHKQSIEKTRFNIRNLRRGDIASLSDILARSFYLEPLEVGGFTALVRFFYPLICWGISADLFSRLSEAKSRHVCLVATTQAEVNYTPQQTHHLFQNLNPTYSGIGSSKLQLAQMSNYFGLGLFSNPSLSSSHQDEIAIATVEVGLQAIPPLHYKFSWFKRQKQYPYISNLAVHYQWRRQGMAQNLLRAAEQTARRWGYGQIFLHVLENNLPARSLYHQLGYELYKIEPDFGAWLFGNPRRLLMCKQLR
jgi:ribosomal protein S18 acetylase RimI-like enzyme